MTQPLGLDPEDPTVRTAVFGLLVQEWIGTPVGEFVMNRVKSRLQRLELDLKKVDPEKPMAVARIQAEIGHWEQFAGWLGDAMQAGLDAQAIIEGEQLADTEDA